MSASFRWNPDRKMVSVRDMVSKREFVFFDQGTDLVKEAVLAPLVTRREPR
jgi:hypothetical protein